MTLPNGVGPPPGLSRTERKFWDVLSDGRPHTPEELAKCLWDDCGINPRSSIKMHISNIRRHLPAGYQILVTYKEQRVHYQIFAEILPPQAPPTTTS